MSGWEVNVSYLPHDETQVERGYKNYELSNHLGNVLNVITDKKLVTEDYYSNDVYVADVVSYSDYYPFGMQMPGRTGGDYRYQFNGMEQDPEVKGNGNSYTTPFRQYDPRLGRWMTPDPLMSFLPQFSPYVAMNNNPISLTDPMGLLAEGGGDSQAQMSGDAGTASEAVGVSGGDFGISSLFSVVAVQSSFSGGDDPKKYKPGDILKDEFKIDMSNAPSTFTTESGIKRSTTYNAKGEKRNSAYYFSELRKKQPGLFSPENNARIDMGHNPIVDDQMIQKIPEFKDFKGQKLEHHHIDHGTIAHLLPVKLHRGKGFYKLWHKSKKILGSLVLMAWVLDLYAIASGDLESLNPIGFLVQEMTGNWEIEGMKIAISQGYDATRKRIANCSSCSEEYRVTYFTDDEFMKYLDGDHSLLTSGNRTMMGNGLLINGYYATIQYLAPITRAIVWHYDKSGGIIVDGSVEVPFR